MQRPGDKNTVYEWEQNRAEQYRGHCGKTRCGGGGGASEQRGRQEPGAGKETEFVLDVTEKQGNDMSSCKLLFFNLKNFWQQLY